MSFLVARVITKCSSKVQGFGLKKKRQRTDFPIRITVFSFCLPKFRPRDRQHRPERHARRPRPARDAP